MGEVEMRQKLQAGERVHGRVLTWVGAEAATLGDVTQLANIYCPGVTLADDFRKHLLDQSKNSIRRVCVNLERTREFCAAQGLKTIDRGAWGDQAFFATSAPKAQTWAT